MSASEVSMEPRMSLDQLPNTAFELVIEYLVSTIGFYKAVRLRLVNRSFNSEILFVLCNKHVLDIDDPATPAISKRMSPSLKARILLCQSPCEGDKSEFSKAIASVNQAMDRAIQQTEEGRRRQHQIIAEAVCNMDHRKTPRWEELYDRTTHIEAQNVLSGAIVLGNLPLVKSLLEAPDATASVNGETPYFGRPLQLAAVWGHLDIVRYLLDRGADPRATSFDAVYEGWKPKNEPRIREMKRHYRSPKGSVLRAAALGGSEDIVNLLLEPQNRISTDDEEYSLAILAAARRGHHNIYRKLIALTGKTLDDFPRLRNEMLWEAAFHGQYEVIQMLLDIGVDIDEEPELILADHGSALEIAASRGDVRMVRFLLARGASIGPSEKLKSNPIISAVKGGHEEVVEILLERGANSDLLSAAAHAGQARLVRWLLARDPGQVTRKVANGEYTVGAHALDSAIAALNPEIVTILLDAGASLDGYPRMENILFYPEVFSSAWMVDFLISLRIIDQGPEGYEDHRHIVEQGSVIYKAYGRGVWIIKRSWKWVGKY
ncbi:hypothetical protein Daesc_009594 [Daldinia eschscholtzii]|uniref:Ankyrin n=1 Tax=Daldinia eschscholtzii TaxID=292717 RepID=A0AAX6MBD9_9PEZI